MSFSSLTLPAEQLSNLNELGYTEMTPVQAAALPAILNGQDVRAKAKTGSGKTAAFGIGLLDKIAVGEFVTQALILCPTRELADQVSKELRRLARFTQNIKILTLCGGQPMATNWILWFMRLISSWVHQGAFRSTCVKRHWYWMN